MILHYTSITLLLLSTLALQAISMPWDNQASSSASSLLKNNEQPRLVSLRPRSPFGSSSNSIISSNDDSDTHLLDMNDITLVNIPNGPMAKHPRIEKVFRPGVAHLATGVSEMHKDRLTGKGIKIGIIDTGVDYKHPALGGDNPATRRVLFGHDFVGNDYDGINRKPSNDPMDYLGHGTAVAGVIGARTATYTGVAPDAILGAYKIYGRSLAPISKESVKEAMDMAYNDGMNIVNISFTTTAEKMEILAQTMQKYAQLNMIIIAAVPNYDKNAIMGWDAMLPGLLPTVISVGGMHVPYQLMDSFYLHHTGYQEEITYKLACGTINLSIEQPSVVSAKPTGNGRQCGVPVNTRGNIVFVPNECNTLPFINTLAQSGAIAIIMSNSQKHLSTCTIPVIKIDSKAMSTMRRLSAQTTPTKITFAGSKKMVPRLEKIVGSKLSAWGPTASLQLSPEIVAPRENPVTTMHGKHGIAGGNSFATPYLAGMTALYFEHCDKNGKTRPNYSQLRSLLQNNAIPYMVPGKSLAGSVAHQGAGMAHIGRMIKSTFSASPSAIELLDIKQWPTSDYTKSANIIINNFSENTQTLHFRHIPAVSMRAFEANGDTTSKTITTDVHIETSITEPQTITLKPKDKASVPITFTIPEKLNYAQHWVYSGYIVIDPEPLVNGRPPSDHAVYVPYLGLNGNIETITMLLKMNGRI
ncbi:peptidase S8/S53 domain-containing protein [Syncephalis plumigaleata]|nr:peptidase S8/S53 domain-containing protein [Syncephalis plumigaleata]